MTIAEQLSAIEWLKEKHVRLNECLDEIRGAVPEGVDYDGMRPAVEMNPSFFAEEEPLRPYFEGLEKRTGVLIESADSAREAGVGEVFWHEPAIVNYDCTGPDGRRLTKEEIRGGQGGLRPDAERWKVLRG